MKIFILLCTAIFLISYPVFAGNKPLVSTMTAGKVVFDEKTKKETFVPADKAMPGDVILYTLMYENKGTTDINNLKAVGPVPENTKYIGKSEKSTVNAVVEFSIDGGKSYKAPPVMYEKKDEKGKIVKIEATPDMYTHVRWTIRVLKAGEKIYLKYRVKVI